MQTIFEKLKLNVQEFHKELELEIEQGKRKFLYNINRKKVKFRKKAIEKHKSLRTNTLKYIKNAKLSYIITIPIIYSVGIPIILLDIIATIYQATCFPIYGIKKVNRSEHVIIDRHFLEYLNIVEKINCVYCGYCNGVLSYVSEIASRTEFFWCPIKHSRVPKNPHKSYNEFIEYGDAKNFQNHIKTAREKCRACEICVDSKDNNEEKH